MKLNILNLTTEKLNVLTVLSEEPDARLAEIHEHLTHLPTSTFEHSPARGEDWNDERWLLQALVRILDTDGLVENNGNDWRLTPAGRRNLPTQYHAQE